MCLSSCTKDCGVGVFPPGYLARAGSEEGTGVPEHGPKALLPIVWVLDPTGVQTTNANSSQKFISQGRRWGLATLDKVR